MVTGAALRSFVIEYESIGILTSRGPDVDKELAQLLTTRYRIGGELLRDIRELSEMRNEILHPVPLPPGTADNWPEYLRDIKKRGLVSPTGRPDADYITMHQIASHRLFVWAVAITRRSFEQS